MYIMFMFDWSALMTSQKATLDSGQHTYTFVIISYQCLSFQFQFSLSAAALGIYLYGTNRRRIPLCTLYICHLSLKGHGNEADFLGFLHKSVRHRSLTIHFEPFRF